MSCALIAGFSYLAAHELRLPTAVGMGRLIEIDPLSLLGVVVVGGAILGATRAWRMVWGVATALALLFGIVAFTPLFESLERSWIRRDPPESVDAVVALSAGVTEEGRFDQRGLARFIAALSEARVIGCQTLIVTDLPSPRLDHDRERRWLTSALGLEVVRVGPVMSTFDEAEDVAHVAAARGWRRIALVTSAAHSRRAAATFEKKGLTVIARPAPERDYSLGWSARPADRIRAFADWITEQTAWRLYRWRGRL